MGILSRVCKHFLKDYSFDEKMNMYKSGKRLGLIINCQYAWVNGKVKAPKTANEGDEVVIYCYPDEGYDVALYSIYENPDYSIMEPYLMPILVSHSSIDRTVDPIEIRFIMPANNVTVREIRFLSYDDPIMKSIYRN